MTNGVGRMRLWRALFLSGAGLALAAHAAAQDGPRMTAIDLGQSGVALYTLVAEAREGESLRLTVPSEQGDDVLASLVVHDAGGGVLGLRTATPSTTDEDLRTTPFVDGLPADSTELLAALVGAQVRVVTTRAESSGTVLGVSTVAEAAGEVVFDRPSVLLLGPDGRASEVALLPGTSVEILNEATAEALARAARSRSGDSTSRVFELDLTGAGSREVELSYVSEAPAWKNSWRLLLAEGRLQGWATLENASGHDWEGVTLTLSTGNPVAYRRDLLAPLRIARSEPPDLIGARPEVSADTGFVDSARAAMAGAIPDMMLEAAPAPAAGAAQPADVLAGIDVRYRIPAPLDLPAGQTADLLYLDLPVDSGIEALYQPMRSAGVLLTVRLSADQALAPGLVSVRDEHGFVGDAPFTGLAAGQSRLLPYAAATGAVVTESRRTRSQRLEVVAADGWAEARLITQERADYRATLPEGVAVFTVEHPKTDRHIVEVNGTVEENAGTWRISVPVSDGAAAVELVEERIDATQLTLDDHGAETLVAIAYSGDYEIDPATRAIIDDAAALLASIHDDQDRLAEAEALHETLTREQERLRANLAAVGTDDLRRRYEGALIEAEDRIAAALATMDEARAAMRESRAALNRLIAKLG